MSNPSSVLSHMKAYEKKITQVFEYLSRIPNEGAETHKLFVTVERDKKTLTKSPKADIPNQESVEVYYYDFFPAVEVEGEGKYTSPVTFATSLNANMGDMENCFTKPQPLDFTFRSYTKEQNKWEVELEVAFKDARLTSLGNVVETASGKLFKVFRVWAYKYSLVQNFFDAQGKKLGNKQSSYDGVTTKFT